MVILDRVLLKSWMLPINQTQDLCTQHKRALLGRPCAVIDIVKESSPDALTGKNLSLTTLDERNLHH